MNSYKNVKYLKFEVFDRNHIIGVDLNTYPYQEKVYNLDAGLASSIKNIRFKEFWFNDKNKFFKIDPSRDCNSHCVILDYLDV
jgi:hypothetical protein